MKKLFLTYCTEYESGWGSKSDGFVIAETLEACKTEINRVESMGSSEIFWRYSEPEEVYCEEETYNKIMTMKRDDKDYIGFNSNSSLKQFELYRKI